MVRSEVRPPGAKFILPLIIRDRVAAVQTDHVTVVPEDGVAPRLDAAWSREFSDISEKSDTRTPATSVKVPASSKLKATPWVSGVDSPGTWPICGPKRRH